ncbi:DedA family protein [Microbacterium sp. EYE_5]|uniref:DedA family protein n=1 Tax=unclassified Microbacterium TaxID=2609290 RepID=UPI002002B82F|nr:MULTISPECIES: DedA family protein [unclassified Microbacterium]MCK6080593.1 DedA family protein [Microbacterium sp. EYE_382]MCK6085864.1 DedA family protein [Microbacterium sp. EYE_384]MCK6124638.1 DedA family protein [Microbacterium sp. EYE_80]MCK6127547.1 DedA family protein [Microbacterium sp. EYE_79]MCK6141548.1 DedA family protein [Microbacterium sp. EYE_39]
MNDILDWLLETVQAVDPVVRTLVAGVAVMLETSVLVGLIVPGDTIVIVAGTAVDSLAEGAWLVLAVLVGALVGESIGYALGRWLGPRIRFSRVGRLIGEHNWTRAELYLRRRGGPAIFLSRFLPVLHSLVPLTVGMSGFAYRRFLAWTTPACALWSIAYVSVTAVAAEGYREISDSLHYAGYLFVGAIVVFLIAVYVVKRIIGAREARHLAPESEPGAEDVKD